MEAHNNDEITHLLNDWNSGDEQAMGKIMDLVYSQLKMMARHYTIKERADNTLNTTGLVHEAFLKIVDQNNREYQNRAHFYAIISTCMRRVILEVARTRNTDKRGSGAHKVKMQDHFLISQEDADQIITVNSALEKLETFDQRLAQMVEYRYFGGMKFEEIAEALECSLSTVKRDWRLARTWLRAEFTEN